MDMPVVLTALAGLFAWLLVWLWMARKNMPPGPLPWPVLGNIFHLGVLPHHGLAQLARTYGPLVFLKLGAKPTIVISSPYLAEEVFKKQGSTWESRTTGTAGELMFYGCSDILFGRRWKFYRNVLTQELITGKRLADFKYTRVEEIMRGITQSIQECASGSKSIRLGVVIKRITLNILMRMLMNEGLPSEKVDSYKNSADFVEALEEFFTLFGTVCIGDFVTCLAPFDVGGYKKRMRIVAKKLDSFFSTIIEDHRRKLLTEPKPDWSSDGSGVQDIVDAMLTCKQDEAGQKLRDSEIKGIIQDFILAGTDTASNTIEWAVSELLKKPSVLEKLRAEMDSVVGKERLVDEADLANLPFLQAVVKETLRLYPGSPVTNRTSTDDSEIAGYKIPRGTMLLVNIYAMQRDPAIWDRAQEFDPDRFLDSKKDVHGRHFDLTPFGHGVRMCPGKALGLLQVTYTLALLIQTCNFRLREGQNPEMLDMDERYTATVCRRNPLELVLTPRTSLHELQQHP